MTLGRTSTGAIKIKTDSPGLRAVGCACCGGGCGECEITIPGSLRELVENATISSISMLGYPPTAFYPESFFGPNVWMAEWYYDDSSLIFICYLFYDKDTGCLFMYADSIEWNPSPNPPQDPRTVGLARFGDWLVCNQSSGELNPSYENGEFTINGEGKYKYFYDYKLPPVPPLNLIFT